MRTKVRLIQSYGSYSAGEVLNATATLAQQLLKLKVAVHANTPQVMTAAAVAEKAPEFNDPVAKPSAKKTK